MFRATIYVSLAIFLTHLDVSLFPAEWRITLFLSFFIQLQSNKSLAEKAMQKEQPFTPFVIMMQFWHLHMSIYHKIILLWFSFQVMCVSCT